MEQIINNANYGTLVKITTVNKTEFYIAEDDLNLVLKRTSDSVIADRVTVTDPLTPDAVKTGIFLDNNHHYFTVYPIGDAFAARFELSQLFSAIAHVVEDY